MALGYCECRLDVYVDVAMDVDMLEWDWIGLDWIGGITGTEVDGHRWRLLRGGQVYCT